MSKLLCWIKERVMECEWHDPTSTETVRRIYYRLRSDGSMWYQVAQRGHMYDLHPELLEGKFTQFLLSDVPPGVHSGWTEQDFDEDFLERLVRMNGREVTPVTQ